MTNQNEPLQTEPRYNKPNQDFMNQNMAKKGNFIMKTKLRYYNLK